MNVSIRLATSEDCDTIHDVYLRAFPADEARLIAELAVNLLREESDPPTISLVAENGREVVGHIAFSRVSVHNKPKWRAYILAPLAVKPKYHKNGIGSKLVKDGIERLSRYGVNMLFVYGDPKYYCRFGFGTRQAANFLPPYKLEYPFGWQAIILKEENTSEQVVQLSCVASLRDPALW